MSVTAPHPSARTGERRADVRADPARLEIVRARARRARRRRALPVVSAATVALSLLAVTLGHSYVAQEQVKLAAIESAVTAAQVQHHQEMVSVANLENPARILRSAEATLHVTSPGHIDQVPHVSLRAPLASPALAPSAGASSGSTPPGR